MVVFLFLRVVMSPCRHVAMSPNQGNTNCRNVALSQHEKSILLFCPSASIQIWIEQSPSPQNNSIILPKYSSFSKIFRIFATELINNKNWYGTSAGH